MSEVITERQVVPEVVPIRKAISWPAVFGGTFVALATELLFAAFGLFIGFTLSSPGGISTWAKVWYFVTAFVALFIGGWVTSRLSVNAVGGGPMHAAITWGLTTIATFAFAIWVSWGLLTNSISAIRTAIVAANTTTAASTTVAQGEASRMRNEPGAAANPLPPQTAGIIAGDASTVFLVIFGGILCGCVGAILGGGLGDVRFVPARRPVPA